jgi:hypothetical protein
MKFLKWRRKTSNKMIFESVEEMRKSFKEYNDNLLPVLANVIKDEINTSITPLIEKNTILERKIMLLQLENKEIKKKISKIETKIAV